MMAQFLYRLARDDRGGTAIEYSLLASLIAVAAIVAYKGLGNQIDSTYISVGDTLKKV